MDATKLEIEAKSYVVEENDEDMKKTNEPQPHTFDEEDEGEIIEYDVELRGKIVEGNNGPPQNSG
ncbi:hypothetical protein LguiB_020020 [Lonicera macranthoides]